MADKNGKIRVAWLSFWQAHAAPATELQFPGAGTIAKALEHPDLDVVATWDDHVGRGRDRSSRLGLPFVEDLDEILADQDIDGVMVSAPTTQHAELITRAVAAGKHVHSAKVLAPTLAEARTIVAAADAAGVVLVTDMGWLSKNYVLRTKELIDQGVIGELVNVRVTHFHAMATFASPVDAMGYYPDGHGFLSKSEGAGGALVDMCHPTYVTPVLCGGLPTTAYARFGSTSGRGDVEDNAVVVYDYDDGPYALVEASWTTPPMTTEIEANGTRGTILYRSVTGVPAAEMFTLTTGQRTEPAAIEPGPDGESPIDQWVNNIRRGTRPDENLARALDLAVLNEAAYRSAAAGSPVALSAI
jgi:predicted dehydrogenase